MASKLRENLERLIIATVITLPVFGFGIYDRNRTEANGGKIANPHVFVGGDAGRIVYDSDGDGTPDYTEVNTFLAPAMPVTFTRKPNQAEIDWYKSTPFKSR